LKSAIRNPQSAMIFDVLTIFPEFFNGPFDHGIIRKAREAGLVEIRVHNLRDYTVDRHQVVDDRPFGGGEGMVLKPEPIFRAVEELWGALAGEGARSQPGGRIVLLSARGRLLNQAAAARLARFQRLMLICGRYEGVDERVAEHLAHEEICVGDYVLTGGELPAAIVVDCVTRLLPGALGHELSAVRESFCDEGEGGGILDCPHYTRPAEFRGMAVPEVLVSGHHEQVRRWRRKKALEKTLDNRPEFLQRVPLGDEDRELLLEIRQERMGRV
jgi:tRNA (guanine37-N1)-methyltransferase